MMILNNGLAVKTALPRLSSLLIGNKSPSFGSVYDSTNGTSINLCRRSIRVLKCSYVPTSVLGNEMRRNSASNCAKQWAITNTCWPTTPALPAISSGTHFALDFQFGHCRNGSDVDFRMTMSHHHRGDGGFIARS